MPVTWISVDPAGKTGKIGFAIWSGHTLRAVGTVQPISKTAAKDLLKSSKTRYTHVVDGLSLEDTPHHPYSVPARSLRDAFRLAFVDILDGTTEPVVVMEDPMGHIIKSVSMMSWIRGFITSMVNEIGGSVIDVNTSEWRRVASERWDVSWPRDSILCKALSVRLAHENFNVLCSNDESDAVLVGHWATRTRTIDP